MIQNTSFGPLSGSNGPFTIAFWFRSGGLNPAPSYVLDAEGTSSQWAVIYGYSSNQIEFVNLIVNRLTERGVIEPAMLYESPFTDLTPSGPEGLFDTPEIDELIAARAEGQPSGAPSDDAEFLRRVVLDLAGRIPSVREAREFLGDDPVNRVTIMPRGMWA